MRSLVLAAVLRLVRLGRPHWRLLAQSAVCMAVVALTTGAYALLMGPGVRFLLTGGEHGLERVFELFPFLRHVSGARSLAVLPVLAVVIGFFKGLGYLGQFYFVGLFGQQVVIDLRRRIFERLTRLSPTQRGAQLSGEILSRFTADVALVEQAATYTVASFLRDSLQLVVLIGVAFFVSWRLSVLALLAVPVAIVPAAVLSASLLRRTRRGLGALGALAAQVQEGVAGLTSIQAFNAQARELERFRAHSVAAQRALTRAAWAKGAVPGVMEVLASSAIAGSLVYALTTRSIAPDVLVSFLGTLILLYQPAKDLGRVSQFALNAAVGLERIEAVLAEPPAGGGVGRRALGPVARSIVFEDVRFSWGEREALRGLSLELRAGEITALVGPSGSGKSTLVALLLGFERPSSGRITLDGVELTEVTLESLRAQFALVTQEPLLLSSTLRDNLRLGRAGASDAEVLEACEAAQLTELLTTLPSGLDTVVGERGVRLSGGQKQKVCLARALVAGAPVLVLDEATSNLDPVSEAEVQRALDTILVGRTAVVIAHRPSAWRGAHRVVLLEAGRVVEAGTPAELTALGGRFVALQRP